MAMRSRLERSFVQRALFAQCVLVAGGCDIVRDPAAFDSVDGPVAVHAMLVAGEPRIAVLVTRSEATGAPGGSGPTHRLLPVTGADVRVASAGESILLDSSESAMNECFDHSNVGVTEVPTSLAPGCYTGSWEEAIAAGARYELEITLRDGTTVTGGADVPRPVTIRAPEAGATIEVRSMYEETDPAPSHPLAWTRPDSNRAVRLRLEAGGCLAWTAQEPPSELQDPQAAWLPGFAADVMFRAMDLTGHDSVDVPGWYLTCERPPSGEIDGVLQLAVLDLGYAEYLDTLARSESIPLAEASLGLAGAAGAFTGAAITRQPVRLIVR